MIGAYVKILKITKTPQKAIDYILDADKTDCFQYVSGYNVAPETAGYEFDMTDSLAKRVKGNYDNVGGQPVKAWHLVQSFSPKDNITPEKAHELGRQLAMEFTGGKHEFVIATHIDKDHLHTSRLTGLLFCADCGSKLTHDGSVDYRP